MVLVLVSEFLTKLILDRSRGILLMKVWFAVDLLHHPVRYFFLGRHFIDLHLSGGHNTPLGSNPGNRLGSKSQGVLAVWNPTFRKVRERWGTRHP
jgi:hypothetical protein